MGKRHLGVVLLVPEPWAREIDGLRRACGDTSLGSVAPHITLVPPVNVARDHMGRVEELVRRVERFPPLSLTLGPPATFAPESPVVFLEVAGDVDVVEQLREDLHEEPLVRTREWPYTPHCTIADEMAPSRISSALTGLADYRIECSISKVVLMEEAKHSGVRAWRPLLEVPLLG